MGCRVQDFGFGVLGCELSLLAIVSAFRAYGL